MGGNYEYTSVPGKSDYDIQVFVKTAAATVEETGDPGWRLVKSPSGVVVSPREVYNDIDSLIV